MKPDKNTCLNCGKQISSKAKYCSDKCRKAYSRKSDINPDKLNPDTDKTQVGQPKSDTFRDSLTKTDKTFYDRAMDLWGEPYYKFRPGEEREAKCGFCGEKFKTTLSLNKYCSYQHYHQSLTAVVQ